jgi:hypothetical protein
LAVFAAINSAETFDSIHKGGGRFAESIDLFQANMKSNSQQMLKKPKDLLNKLKQQSPS